MVKPNQPEIFEREKEGKEAKRKRRGTNNYSYLSQAN